MEGEKREESDPAEAADLYRGSVPISRCWVSQEGELQTHTEAYSQSEVKNSHTDKHAPCLPSCKMQWWTHVNICTLHRHSNTQSLYSQVLFWRKLLSLPSSPLSQAVHNLLSAETHWQDKTHSCTDGQNGLHCALMTRPAEMTFDPQTQVVWPVVDWWEWPFGQHWPLGCSLLTTSCLCAHLMCLCVQPHWAS